MKEIVVLAEKKEWQTPSLESLTITMTFGGSGSPEQLGSSGPNG